MIKRNAVIEIKNSVFFTALVQKIWQKLILKPGFKSCF